MNSNIIKLITLAIGRTNALALSKTVFKSLHKPRISPGTFQVMAATTSSLHSIPTIASYLEKITGGQSIDDGSKVNIIMGNEAGDADSIVSSLTLGHVNSMISGKERDENTREPNYISLPLASIQRNDLALRRDVVLLIKMAGIDGGKLVFIDDDRFISVAQNKKIEKEITLVDHNKIRSDLDYLKDAVTEILDHHQDEGAHDNVIDDVRKVAFKGTSALVGSTCTLVTERLMETKVGLNKETDKLDAGLGIMLLGVILLDTMNMNKEAAKGTPRDGRAIDFLLQRTDWSTLQLDDVIRLKIFADGDDSSFCSQAPSRSKLYEYLRDSKFDKSFWESMSPRDALRIDYKRFEPPTEACDGFGLSSVLLSMEKLIAKDNFFQEAEKYMFEANVDLLGVLTMVIVDDIPQRELLLIGNTNKVEDMTEYLLKDAAAAHLKIVRGNMIESSLGKNLSVSYLKQGNPKGSRKQVAPLMMAFYQN